MEDHRVKRLRHQAFRFGECDPLADGFRQLLSQIAMQRVVLPQRLASGGQHGGKLHQRILLVIGHAQYAIFARGETNILLERLWLERSLSVNTAAAGGNASLMTIG